MVNSGTIYANATASSLMTKLINHDKLSRLLDAKNGETALKMVMEFGFGEGVTVTNPFEFELLCDKEEENLYNFIIETCPSEHALKCLTLSYDYHNLKSALKVKYGKNVDYGKLVYRYTRKSADELKDQVLSDNYEDLSLFQAELCKKIDEFHILGNLTPLKIDIESNLAMYSEIFQALKNAHDPLLMEYYQKKVNFINLSTVVRAKAFNLTDNMALSMLIPFGTFDETVFTAYLEGNGESLIEKLRFTEYKELGKVLIESESDKSALTKYEQMCENMLMDIWRDVKFIPEQRLSTYFSYVFARYNIIKNVRLIMVCVNNSLDTAEIRERLVETYDR